MSDLDRLADMIANLDQYIDRRACEIAAPRIAEIQAAAAQDVEAAATRRRIDADLIGELRRQLAIATRAIADGPCTRPLHPWLGQHTWDTDPRTGAATHCTMCGLPAVDRGEATT